MLGRRKIGFSALLAICSGLGAAAALGEDVPGSRDHPLLSRFPGSVIKQYSAKDFDEMLWCTDSYCEECKTVEGKVTRIAYAVDESHSTLEMVRSYEKALVKAGFEPVFSCSSRDGECPEVYYYLELPGEDPLKGGERFRDDGRRFSVLRRGDSYVSVFAYQGADEVRVRIVEVEELGDNLIASEPEVSVWPTTNRRTPDLDRK